MDQHSAGKWVFAYGSLMWEPGFAPLESALSRLYGWHRALCIKSLTYRGTVDNPGLVLGLDRGGSCMGKALKVSEQDWPQIKAALDARELINQVYIPKFLNVHLMDGRKVSAYVYVADRRHGQYWAGSLQHSLALIERGHGRAGSSREYLDKTIAHLGAMGIKDKGLLTVKKALALHHGTGG